MQLRSLAQILVVALALVVSTGLAHAQSGPPAAPNGYTCQQVQPSGGDGATALAQLASPTGVAAWLQGVWLRSLGWVRSEVAATSRIERVRRVATTPRTARRVR